jgi:hypothetical protein
MFTAVGEIASIVQKQPYDKLIEDRIFKPLGMTNSTMSMKQMEKVNDFSYGYSYNPDTKETRKLPFRDIDEIAPAGSINSSARDMAEWLRFVMNGGAVGGKRLVSESGYNEWLKPQMRVSGAMSYGFGWFLEDWNGLKVVQHGGNIDGFNSLVAMIPEKKLGFVLLTNVSASSLGTELMPVVWKELLGDVKADENVQLPIRTMQRLAGTYRLEAAKVDLDVKIENDNLVLIAPGQPHYTLKRTAPRQFDLEGAPAGFSVKFVPETGDATGLVLTQPNFTGTLPRVKPDGTLETVAPAGTPAAANTTAAKELIGKYESDLNGRIAEIKELDGQIALVVGSQPPFTLTERSKDVYNMAPLPEAYFVTVKRDPAGKIARFIVTQPEGEFGFKNLAYSGNGGITITTAELTQKALDAVGGAANWRKLTSRVVTYETDMLNQGLRVSGTSYAKAPNKTAASSVFTALGKPVGKEWEFFDGTTGRDTLSFAPSEAYSGKRLADVKLGADFYGMLDWEAKYKKIEITRVAKVGDEDCYAVVFTPNEGSRFTEYYSTKSFLLLKRDGNIPIPGVGELPYTILFSDYRDIDGVKLAYKSTSQTISNGESVTTVTSVKHNVKVDDKIFAPRKL